MADGAPLPRVALVVGRHSYRARAFLDATRTLGIDSVVVTDHRPPLAGDGVVHVDDIDDVRALGHIDGVVSADDWGVSIAARLATRLGLIGNTPDSVAATLDKRLLRARLGAAGLRQPEPSDDGPWVVKPVDRSAGEGVVLVTTVAERDRVILTTRARYGHEPLVEGFVSGPEAIIEGVLVDGRLHVAASFDKPGDRGGPTFPETMLVSPSGVEPEAVEAASAACRALDVRNGPVHIEVIIGRDGPVVIEVHARSIGGLCSAVVATDPPLEQLIVLAAIGRPATFARRRTSTGVFMLPVPQTGRLIAVDGLPDASAVGDITGIDITALGRDVVALPERGEYLGFVYAAAATPERVERALGDAVAKLSYRFVGA